MLGRSAFYGAPFSGNSKKGEMTKKLGKNNLLPNSTLEKEIQFIVTKY